MAARHLRELHCDLGIGDVIIDPAEEVRTRDWLGFADMDAPRMGHPESNNSLKRLTPYTLPREVDLTLPFS